LQARVLFAIWRLKVVEKRESVGLEEIRKVVRRSKTHVANIIFQIRHLVPDEPDLYIIRESYFPSVGAGMGRATRKKARGGKPLSTYFLNHNRFVTSWKTAIILLEFADYRPPDPYSDVHISKSDFKEYLLKKYPFFDDAFVTRAIVWGSQPGTTAYIQQSAELPDIIYQNQRIDFERNYLRLLVESHDRPDEDFLDDPKK
jgi:hypothetical protein